MNHRSSLIAAVVLLLAMPATARVTRVEVTARNDVGRYETIAGRVYYALDPANAHNAAIVDLDKAPRNASGEVEFSADLFIIRPKEGRNGTLFFEVSNRGGKGFVGLDPKSEADIRDPFLLERGYTLAWVGWQFDVRPEPGRVRLYAPVATGVRGIVRSDFIVDKATNEFTVSHIIGGAVGGTGYPAADLTTGTLTERDALMLPRRTIPRAAWRFKDPTTLQYDAGFQPGKIYDVMYTAKDPAVVGAGLAAVRDFVAYCKHDPRAIAPAERAYGFGISQSGRFLRHFLYQGFNADEEGRQVFDAMDIHVAGAGRGNFNHRFAQPSRDAQPLAPAMYPVDIYPFADLPTPDPLTRVSAGLLDRAAAEHVVPKIFYTNTSYEYWSRGESLCHTTADGTRDLDIPDTSRIYLLSGIAHAPGPFPPVTRDTRNLANPSSYWPTMHALLEDLDAWVRKGVAPPASRYPRISDGTLVRPADLAAKQIAFPDVYEPFKLAPGMQWPKGILTEPPSLFGTYPTLVPQVRDDGNEIAGVHLPRTTVPLAAYTGWNFRAANIGFPNSRSSFLGSYLPFDSTPYRDKNEYLGRYAAAALKLIDERFLTSADLESLLRRGAEEWDAARGAKKE
jgi:hypothetical protein